MSCGGGCGALTGEVRSSVTLRNFCDDLRGGGLGGMGANLLVDFWRRVPPFFDASRTVEFEDDEVVDSRTAASPLGSLSRESGSLVMLPVRRLVTGGRVRLGLICLFLTENPNRLGATNPGDWDDIDVGVVSRL